MIFNKHKKSNVKEYSLKQVPAFAFIPESISNPQKGYIWWEFYNKVYEFRNGAWHFEGKLHQHFSKATFTNNEGQKEDIEYLEASITYKVLYFLRYIFILLLWLGIIYEVIYFFHNHLK